MCFVLTIHTSHSSYRIPSVYKVRTSRVVGVRVIVPYRLTHPIQGGQGIFFMWFVFYTMIQQITSLLATNHDKISLRLIIRIRLISRINRSTFNRNSTTSITITSRWCLGRVSFSSLVVILLVFYSGFAARPRDFLYVVDVFGVFSWFCFLFVLFGVRAVFFSVFSIIGVVGSLGIILRRFGRVCFFCGGQGLASQP